MSINSSTGAGIVSIQSWSKYVSVISASYSNNVSDSLKFIIYCTGSEAIYSCLVPMVLMNLILVNMWIFSIVVVSGAPT